MEFISLHRCIRNTSIDATILTERRLKTSRRPWTPEGLQRSLHNWVGQKKEGRRRRRGSGTGPAPWGRGAEAEERFPNSGKPLSDWEINWDRREAFEAVGRG